MSLCLVQKLFSLTFERKNVKFRNDFELQCKMFVLFALFALNRERCLRFVAVIGKLPTIEVMVSRERIRQIKFPNRLM